MDKEFLISRLETISGGLSDFVFDLSDGKEKNLCMACYEIGLYTERLDNIIQTLKQENHETDIPYHLLPTGSCMPNCS